jgi:hypothetical protein
MFRKNDCAAISGVPVSLDGWGRDGLLAWIVDPDLFRFSVAVAGTR